MLGLGDLDVGRAGSDEAHQIGGVVGMEELRLRAADEGERRAGGLDQWDGIEPRELLPEMRVEAQRPAALPLGVDRLSAPSAGR